MKEWEREKEYIPLDYVDESIYENILVGINREEFEDSLKETNNHVLIGNNHAALVGEATLSLLFNLRRCEITHNRVVVGRRMVQFYEDGLDQGEVQYPILLRIFFYPFYKAK
ncbi:unnamed protein product [Rhizophagus irregularis]|nr:unnamed protein product [Rhizophagus irregularis]